MNRLGQISGVALVGALAVTVALLPLVAHLHLEVQIEALLARNSAARTQALYSAEAGLALALEELGRGIDADRLYAGPDGVAGTEDDGGFPFAAGPPAGFPDDSWSVAVAIRPAVAGHAELIAQATGPRANARRVRALVALPAAPGEPPRLAGWQEIT
jgi:hypothetical protein